MSNHTEHKSFVFNNKIDQELLHSLYEDDFAYIEEIFSITLSQLRPDFAKLQEAFEAQDIAELRKLVHKIKPSFGFVGLPAAQQFCKQFEDLCANNTSVATIKDEYQTLYNVVSDGISVIEADYAKLKVFNRP